MHLLVEGLVFTHLHRMLHSMQRVQIQRALVLVELLLSLVDLTTNQLWSRISTNHAGAALGAASAAESPLQPLIALKRLHGPAP